MQLFVKIQRARNHCRRTPNGWWQHRGRPVLAVRTGHMKPSAPPQGTAERGPLGRGLWGPYAHSKGPRHRTGLPKPASTPTPPPPIWLPPDQGSCRFLKPSRPSKYDLSSGVADPSSGPTTRACRLASDSRKSRAVCQRPDKHPNPFDEQGQFWTGFGPEI